MGGESGSGPGARDSLAFEGLELAGAGACSDRELVVRPMLNHAAVDHLGHEVRGRLAGLVLLLQGLDLVLQLLDHGELGLDVGLLLRGGLLLRLDLGQGAAALGADLEHVGRDSLGY